MRYFSLGFIRTFLLAGGKYFSAPEQKCPNKVIVTLADSKERWTRVENDLYVGNEFKRETHSSPRNVIWLVFKLI